MNFLWLERSETERAQSPFSLNPLYFLPGIAGSKVIILTLEGISIASY